MIKWSRPWRKYSRKTELRLIPVAADDSISSLTALGASKADLAIARADIIMPSNAETVAIVRKEFVVLWVVSKATENGDKRRRVAQIKDIAGLNGHRVGLVGEAPENVELLKIILSGSGVEPEKVAVKQFAPDKISDLAGDASIDAVMVVQPLDSKIISEAVKATIATKGEPKFLAVEASEAIAMKHPRYASGEIPLGVFNSSPARPDDKVETMSVDHLIVARKNLSEATVASFARQLFGIRRSLARQSEGAARLQKPDTDKMLNSLCIAVRPPSLKVMSGPFSTNTVTISGLPSLAFRASVQQLLGFGIS
jgi:TRAP-type uncharacterized transport system substrate-binding protein